MIDNAPARLTEIRPRLEWLRTREIEVNNLVGEALAARADASSLRTERREIREETEDLCSLELRLEREVFEQASALRLAIARREGVVERLRSRIEALHADRVALFGEGARLAQAKTDVPDFPKRLRVVEESIQATTPELEDIVAVLTEERGRLQQLEQALGAALPNTFEEDES